MFKKTFVILIITLFIVGVSDLSVAMTCGSHGDSHQSLAQAESEQSTQTQEVATTEAVDVGNEICPVTGEKIDDEIKTTYEYEGKIYNFCCPMCIDEFKKDPEKYIKKVEEELKAQPKEEAKEHSIQDSQTPMDTHAGHHH